MTANGLFGSCRSGRRPRDITPRSATAFEKLYLDNEASVYGYLARRLGPSLAEDVAAETFASAWQCFAHLEATTKVRTWLMGLAIERLQAYRDAELAYLRGGSSHPAVARVAHALADLDARDRDMLTLHVWAELSDECVARVIDLPCDVVRQRVSAALRYVRRSIDDDPEPSD